MYRKILIGGVIAAAIVGAGSAALATTGSSPSTGSSGSRSATHQSARSHHGTKGTRMKARRLLRRVDHAQIVVHTRKGFVTHELIRGTVTGVTASSITVASADHVTDTFTVTPDTKVRKRTDGTPTASTIGSVATGDRVFVAGIGAGTPVARHVIDRGAK